MASIRLRAVSGASFLIVPTAAGTSFHMESSGSANGAHDAPDIVLTYVPEGVRVSIVHHGTGNNVASPTSNLLPHDDDRTPSWRFPEPESFDFESTVEDAAESSRNREMLDQLSIFPPVFPMATSDFLMSAFDNTNPEFNSEDLNANWSYVTDLLSGDSPVIVSRSESSLGEVSSSSVADCDSPSPATEGASQSQAGPPIRGLPCRIPGCGRLCLREHTRRKHEEAHASKAPLSCSEPGCSTTFSRPHDKLRHEVRKHGHPCHTCSVCNNLFSHARGLEKHKCQTTKTRGGHRSI
ncbi:hypothetical protein DFH09DRAFT_1183436 [Mycena vulgaris]|nr:hypothetical protein DFH09DRAFT_1183436 [Mycena vulgaris]